MTLDLDDEITKDYRKQAFLRDQGKCRYCGLDFLESLSMFWSYTVDHIVAKAVDGPDTVENIVICCKACNEALCRSGHLRTIDERRNYVKSQEASRTPIFEAWRARLGR